MRLAAFRKIPHRLSSALNSFLDSIQSGGPFARLRSSRGNFSTKPIATSVNSASDDITEMANFNRGKPDDPGGTGVFGAAAPIPAYQDISPTKAPLAASPRPMLSSLAEYPDRVVGCLLGKMCGDVLGAGVEGWSLEDIQLSNPNGLTDFLQTERGFGCYTDDTQMAIALARSLVACNGRADAVHVARTYAEEYHPSRGYGGTAYKILAEIKQHGIDSDSIRTISTKYIPSGSFGNGGAMRIAPLGLVYRHAPPEVLQEAVAAALRCTHVHPVAIDGAFVIALAVGYLAVRQPAVDLPLGSAAAAAATAFAHQGGSDLHSGGGAAEVATVNATGNEQMANADREGQTKKTTPPPVPVVVGAAAVGPVGDSPAELMGAEVATPVGLLDYLLSYTPFLETQGMAQKLQAVKSATLQVRQTKGPNETWAQYFASPTWAAELRLQASVSEPFQIRADDAAAAALAALCFHWAHPEDAVVAAVHYGGDTDTVAAITGALAGALYGTQWLPSRWYDNVENGQSGRDDVIKLAVTLARLETTTTGA